MTWYQIATIIILGYFLIGALIVIGMLENSEGRALEMKEWPDKEKLISIANWPFVLFGAFLQRIMRI